MRKQKNNLSYFKINIKIRLLKHSQIITNKALLLKVSNLSEIVCIFFLYSIDAKNII
jgi:hypothetical protein